ncbi:MAG: aldehyde dehydrogenase family protein, partial [Phycisphaerales bacterium]|nr:aldehyde dehydrogenase family protein [Phycisphaerales bacterium]
MSECFFERHQEKIESAINAIQDRGYYSAYPEVPSGKIYGEHAKSEGKAFFDSVIGSEFWLNQSTIGSWIGDETSPYGIELGVSYPDVNVDELLTAMTSACDGWKKASVETRVGCALEILDRLNKKSFDMAFAVMHTTGQGFMMAFQAGGPHAQDRGLEAVAYAYKAMLDCPTEATWKKQVGKDEFVTLDKQFKIVPRGIGLVIACSTFPTWNSYPGLFASLVTGNGVIVKPHPQA